MWDNARDSFDRGFDRRVRFDGTVETTGEGAREKRRRDSVGNDDE
jgi:hypothetical protein